LADDHPATGFDHTGANAKAKRAEVIIFHAVPVVGKIIELLASFIPNFSGSGFMAADGTQYSIKVAQFKVFVLVSSPFFRPKFPGSSLKNGLIAAI